MIWSYMKPNGKVIFQNRNSSKCDQPDFDFEHVNIWSKADSAVREDAKSTLILLEFL